MIGRRRARRAARQIYRLSLVGGLPDDSRLQRIAHTVATSPHRGALAILTQLLRLVRLDRDRRSVLVESVGPLPDDLRLRVTDALARAHGSGLLPEFVENPSLVGGMRVRIGSTLYDDSIRARLAAIEAVV